MALRCRKLFNVWMSAIRVGELQGAKWLICRNLGVSGRPDAVLSEGVETKVVRGLR